MRSRTERKVPRWMAWRSMIPNQTSTRFSHNPEVGVKWTWILGFGVVVHDQVQLLAGRSPGEVVEVELAPTGGFRFRVHATPQGAAAVRRHRVHKATDCGLPRWLLLGTVALRITWSQETGPTSSQKVQYLPSRPFTHPSIRCGATWIAT